MNGQCCTQSGFDLVKSLSESGAADSERRKRDVNAA